MLSVKRRVGVQDVARARIVHEQRGQGASAREQQEGTDGCDCELASSGHGRRALVASELSGHEAIVFGRLAATGKLSRRRRYARIAPANTFGG